MCERGVVMIITLGGGIGEDGGVAAYKQQRRGGL